MQNMSVEQRSGPSPLSFSDFLEKMKDPKAADLVRSIKNFIREFEKSQQEKGVDVDRDGEMVQKYMTQMENVFVSHPVWKGDVQEVADLAVEGLEKYIMSKLWQKTFGVSMDEKDGDERYARLCDALGFLELSTLMGVEIQPNLELVAKAQDELLKMDKYKAPRDKLLCLVNVKTIIEEIIGDSVKKGASIGGADAFFPILVLVVIRAKPHALRSNIEYIRRYRGPRVMGQFDFMLSNLESVAVYLDTVDYKDLKISEDEFLARLMNAGIPEARLQIRQESSYVNDVGVDEARSQSDRPDVKDAEVQMDLLSGDYSALPSSTGEESYVDDHAKALIILKEQEKVEENSDMGFTLEEMRELKISQDDPNVQTGSMAHEDSGLHFIRDSPPSTPVPISKPQLQLAENNDESQIWDRHEYNTIKSLIEEGTPLVLYEESAGRLLQKHPWIYANAEDLKMGEVAKLVAAYRDLVLKHEALCLALQEHLPIPADFTRRSSSHSAIQISQEQQDQNNGNQITTSNEGGFIQKLTSWSGSSGDQQSTLLHSLFGRGTKSTPSPKTGRGNASNVGNRDAENQPRHRPNTSHAESVNKANKCQSDSLI